MFTSMWGWEGRLRWSVQKKKREGGWWCWGKKREGGREDSVQWSKREREEEREKGTGTGKKGKGSREGKDWEDAPTAYRCWSLWQRSAVLSGHRKMVSVRGELTVAYNLMFNILDSFSMGNATARNSRAKLAFLLFDNLLFIRFRCFPGSCLSP